MAENFLGEVRLMSFNYAPKGWALCNGQTMPINQNQALYALLGLNFGGDGRINFNLPNLMGKAPLDVGNGFVMGATGGENTHTLINSEMPIHSHQVMVNTVGSAASNPSSSVVLANNTAPNIYAPAPAQANQTMNSGIIGSAGGSQPHENRQPFLTISFCIAIQGIFPSRN